MLTAVRFGGAVGTTEPPVRPTDTAGVSTNPFDSRFCTPTEYERSCEVTNGARASSVASRLASFSSDDVRTGSNAASADRRAAAAPACA